MQNKIIIQLMDRLGATTTLSATDSFELTLQILAWAKLTNTQAIPESQRISTSLLSDPARIVETMIQLGEKDGLLHEAFGNSKRLGRLDPVTLGPAIDLALRLSETGVLQSMDASDAVTALNPWAGGEAALPPEVATLMVKLAQTQTGDSVYTPWDSSGQLAARAVKGDVLVYLETPLQSAIPSLVSLLAEKPFEVHHADPIRSPSAVEGGKPRIFDVAIAFPPFGLRYDFDVVERDWFGRFPERTPSGAILTVRHLLSQARRRVVVAVQNSLLFSTGTERALREDLIKRGQVEAVVAMPSGLMANNNVPFALLLLDPAGGHDRIKFINADTSRHREAISKAKCRLANLDELAAQVSESSESDDTALISRTDVLGNDAQLQVSRYVLPDTKKQLQARLASAETMTLGDIVATIRPMTTTSDEEDVIEAREIGAADLPPLGYINTPGRTVKIGRHIASRNEQQFLRPLDIVLIVKGSVGKVGIVPQNVPPPGPGGWVIGQSAIALRAGPKVNIDPRALALQLRSPLGQELLSGIVSGASIQLIQLRELTRLQVLVPDLETAHRAAEALEQEAQLQGEIDRLRQEQTQVAADLWTLD